jgi:hypothetical protein
MGTARWDPRIGAPTPLRPRIKDTDAVFAARGIDPELNPFGVVAAGIAGFGPQSGIDRHHRRAGRDRLDGHDRRRLARKGLGTMVEEILARQAGVRSAHPVRRGSAMCCMTGRRCK